LDRDKELIVGVIQTGIGRVSILVLLDRDKEHYAKNGDDLFLLGFNPCFIG